MLFGRDDWTLFRNLATLGQKAGVGRDRLAQLALKELADNALDAGAKCTVGEMTGGWYFVEDDGEGIEGDDAYVARLFSIKRPLTSSKLFRLPTRGALGNGLRVVAGCVLASGGKLRVRTRGRWLELAPQDDGSTQPTKGKKANATGTRVEIKFGADLAEQEDILNMAEVAVGMRGASKYQGKTSPHWYDSDSFFETLQAAGSAPAHDVLMHFDGYGDREITAAAESFSRYDTDGLLADMRTRCHAPKPQKLGEVGRGTLPSSHGYAKKFGTMELAAARGNLAAKVPAVVEVWATKLETGGSPQVLVFVNRTLVSAEIDCGQDSGREGRMWISGCGLHHYVKTGRAPMKIYLCITSPYVPITTDGKEPNLEPLLAPIAEALTSAARKAKLATANSGNGRASKKDLIFSVMQEAVAHASGDGQHRFSLRQLFYQVRPLLQRLGDDLDGKHGYNYFASVVTDYELRIHGDVPGIYRDARGMLYHPHSGEQIALGTLNVEQYKRPEWRFNKILYIEKGGFFPQLIDAKWAEKHDCALLTSQGFASRAARDVIDLLGESAEELLFFCIHDADGPGTMIYQALVEGTRARPGRSVKVVNLGLEPWEGEDMGLQAENVERKSGRVPVAAYVDEDAPGGGTRWSRWLQSNRIELNAMSSPQFLKWLNEKMETYDSLGKVVPPVEVLSDKFQEGVRKGVRDRLIESWVKETKLDDRVAKLLKKAPTPETLRGAILQALDKRPTDNWEKPLQTITSQTANKLVKKTSAKEEKR